jgi:ABC-type nitrate/sulfonate/bicarbonate transport system substrate-binding protein
VSTDVAASIAVLSLCGDDEFVLSMVTAWSERHPEEMARAFLDLVKDATGTALKPREEALREAHAAYSRGRRDSATVLLEREYQRLRKQNNRAYAAQRADRQLRSVSGGGV